MPFNLIQNLSPAYKKSFLKLIERYEIKSEYVQGIEITETESVVFIKDENDTRLVITYSNNNCNVVFIDTDYTTELVESFKL